MYLAFQPPICDAEVEVAEDESTDVDKAVTPNGAQAATPTGLVASLLTLAPTFYCTLR